LIHTVTANPALDRELVVPRLEFNEVLRAEAVRSDCGGKGFNVSRMLAALGEPSIAIGLVGGETGSRLERGLEAAGVGTDFVRIEGETRTNVTIVSSDRARHVKVNEPGPLVRAAEQRALLDKLRSLARSDGWWVLSGSLPRGIGPQFYAQAIRIIHDAGGRAVLDAGGEALAQGCAAGPFLAKPNAQEAAELTGVEPGEPRAAREAAQRMHGMGVDIVAVSLGDAGALISRGGRWWLARAPAIRVRSAIGAGDALLAGLVHSLKRGDDLPQALGMAVACGTAAAGTDGTGVPGREEVARILREVRVESFDPR
jgi:1-phosphofructokinase family hexose kinase